MGKTKLTFTNKTYVLDNLINDIETGIIALPDLQRPFVWDTKKARDLIDSLYNGLPVGVVVLWEILEVDRFKKINLENKRNPRFLVIDGQQRLTSLYSVIKNKEIISKNVHKFKIKIAFNPIEEKFEVSNPALEKSKEWISDISYIFESASFLSFVKNYLEQIKDLDVEENIIYNRIEKVRNILNYPFQVLELSKDLEPEEVSEIFVRINSKGQSLNQSDFILTLMSVYWPSGREKLESFCKSAHHIPEDNKASAYNIMGIKPTPEQLIRTIVGYSFDRGRLKYAYLILKGRDFENRQMSIELREKNLEKFKKGQEIALNFRNWHDFIKIIYSAGFIADFLISSKVAFFVTYAIYLKLINGNYGLELKEIESLIRKWFVFSILTQRYTGSPESTIEDDFKKIKTTGVIDFIKSNINTYLSDDFWNIILPEQLESSSTRNFAYLVFLASLIKEDVKVLFSDIKLRDFLKPKFKSTKKTIELHHIYPRKYLEREHNIKKTEYNQIANYVYIEYKDNIKINDKKPLDYWHLYTKDLSDIEKKDIYDKFCLPEDFPNMGYADFLSHRRKLIAKKIKEFFYGL